MKVLLQVNQIAAGNTTSSNTRSPHSQTPEGYATEFNFQAQARGLCYPAQLRTVGRRAAVQHSVETQAGTEFTKFKCVVLHTETSNMRVHCDMSALHITPCGQQTPNLLGPLCVRALCIFHLDMHTHIAATPKHSQPHARTHGRTHTNTYIMIMAHPGRNQAGGYSQRTCLSNTDCSA